ncbi:MAG: PD40 domain-containing protein [Candidatus Eiseniibacteriota bacterium]|nr:MAG: PD40 domain-containing protein [Candidatus Eisenbacteria bacterium]
MRSVTCFLFLLLLPLAVEGEPLLGYYRYPTIHGERIVFTAEGDLWTVGSEGGIAQRLTTHHGRETHAAFSPDGTILAFSGEYEGPTEVYTIPLEGGLPTRRTFEGEGALVLGWTPGGKILYSTRHYSGLPNAQLATINLTTDESELLPLSQASEGVFDETGSTLFFTRLPFQGSHTKRYKGGAVQNLWKFEEGSAEASPLTADYAGTSKEPMWWAGRVYFVSDRDGTMNLWSMDEEGGDLKQHTFHRGWDVSAASSQGGRIVYQLVADIYLYDIATGEDRLVPITLASDFDQAREKWIKKPADFLTSVHVSPDGDRVVLTARGQVFVAPVEQGRLVEATRKSGVRYRDARFMPDGESIVLLSDETGEMEFWEVPANGVGERRPLTRGGEVFRFDGVPSPDGRWLAFSDKDYQLWILDVKNGDLRRVATSSRGEFSDLRWSPDSRWLAYVSPADNYNSQIMLYGLGDRSITPLTGDRLDSYSPAWSADGKWLYFLSDRFFRSLVRSPWGPRQPEPFFDKTTQIFMISLLKDQRSPFQPDDELLSRREEEKGKEEQAGRKEEGAKEQSAGDQKPPQVRIQLDGLQGRVVEVPLPSGNYSQLTVTQKHLFLLERETSLDARSNLVAVEIKNEDVKAETVLEDVKSYELSADLKKLMVHKGDDVFVFEASGEAPGEPNEHKVNLEGWTFPLDPREEWKQMFVEAWRLQRDYFYDPALHGVDWKAQLEKHLPLVGRVSDRDELNDLIGHLVGELSALHIFVRGGDRRSGEDQIDPASLGAVLYRDENAGGYRVERLLRSDPDYPETLSPLAKPGTNISEGDVIQTINGVPALSVKSASALLKNCAGRQVLLRVRSKSTRKSFDAVVKPITPDEAEDLRYREWEYTRRLLVEEKGGGDIGYVHLRAMGGRNYSEWVRDFYPVYDRKGLIIDVRNNQGGNIDSWILEKLMRRAWFYWQSRVGEPYWNMQYAFRGHMVVLCNEWTMSDGEAFTEGFRRLGLGKVIGTRTWGGEIWLSFSNFRLVDRGIATSAESGVYGPEGEWLIEGHGVEPDVVVDNLPHSTFKGEDAQLEAAIGYLQRQMREHPVETPPPPPRPDKSFRHE